MDAEKQQAMPITQEELQIARKFLANCTVVVNSHNLATRIKTGTLTQYEFNDLCKLFELNGYDIASTSFKVRVDTHIKQDCMISQVPAFANRKTRRVAGKMERLDARRPSK